MDSAAATIPRRQLCCRTPCVAHRRSRRGISCRQEFPQKKTSHSRFGQAMGVGFRPEWSSRCLTIAPGSLFWWNGAVRLTSLPSPQRPSRQPWATNRPPLTTIFGDRNVACQETRMDRKEPDGTDGSARGEHLAHAKGGGSQPSPIVAAHQRVVQD